MKFCPKCKIEKESIDFSKQASSKDGLQRWCSKCMAISAHLNRFNRKEYNKKYHQRKEVKLKAQERTELRRISNILGEKARQLLQSAVLGGRIFKPNICSICKEVFLKKQIHGHHFSYKRPYDVAWVCVDCHTTFFHPRISQYFTSQEISYAR